MTPPGSPAVSQFNIARYNTDGTLDTSFNPGPSGVVRSVLLLPDGSMILGGNSSNFYPGSNTNLTPVLRQGVAKLTAAGVLEPSFNINFGAVHALTQTADGSVLIGTATGVRKFSTSGVEDTTFSVVTNGIVNTLAVQTDGRILVGGAFTTVQPTGSTTALARPRLVRLQANGAHDPAFVPANTEYGEIQCIAHRADGGLLIGGYYLGSFQGSFTRLINEPATQNLNVTSIARVEWNRSGGGAEVYRVLFDLSTDNGTTWTPLGNGSRIGTTANWQITGLSLPTAGTVRVRGFTRNGMHGTGSTSIFEQTKSFTAPAGDVPVVTLPTATDLWARGATLGATVLYESGAPITERGLIYSRTVDTAMPTLGQVGVRSLNKVGTLGAFNIIVPDLQPTTGYTLRGYAINSYGIGYTAPFTFTTPAGIPLSIMGNSATRAYGAADPAFTGTITGLIAGDGITATYTSSAIPTSPPGTYEIVPIISDPLNRLVKYALTDTPGTYTITAAGTSLTTAAASKGFSALAHSTMLSATVRSTTAGQPLVTGGTVTFQLKTTGGVHVGTAVTSSQIVDGVASVNYPLPAGQAAGTYTIATSYSGTSLYTSSTDSGGVFTLVASPLQTFAISPIASPVAAGLDSTFTVTARNASNQTLTSYLGTIRFTSADPAAVLPSEYTFTAGDAGVRTFTVTLRTTGFQSVTVTDPQVAVTATASATVTPRPYATGLLSCGQNDFAQVGHGILSISVNAPGPVVGLTGTPASVATGQHHSLVAMSSGEVYAWGSNGNGQLGNGTTTRYSASVRVVDETGTGFLSATKVAAGKSTSLAIKSNGTVVQWGQNPWSPNTNLLRPQLVAGLANVVEIAAGDDFCLARTSGGTVWAWGSNQYGQLGQGTLLATAAPVLVKHPSGTGNLGSISSISAGDTHALACDTTGSVYSWGSNFNRSLGDGTTTSRSLPGLVNGLGGSSMAVSANLTGCLALRTNGTVYEWGAGNTTPTAVAGLNGLGFLGNVTSIASGAYHRLALLQDGGVVAWGSGTSGQLGQNNTANSTTPVRVADLTGTIALAHGPRALHSVAIVRPPIFPKIVVSGPIKATSGVPITLTLRTVDAKDNAVAFVGSVTVTTSPSEPLTGAVATFTAADQGVKTLTLTLRYTGSKTLNFTSTSLGRNLSGSYSVTVAEHPSQTVTWLSPLGSRVTATSSVFLTPEGGLATAGTVTYRLLNSGGTNIISPRTAAISPTTGEAQIQLTIPNTTPAGDYNVQATYNGDAMNAPSTSLRPLRIIAGGLAAPLNAVSGKYSSSSLTTYSATNSGSAVADPELLEGRLSTSVAAPLSYKTDHQVATFTATGILPVGEADQGHVAFTLRDTAGAVVGLPNVGPVVGGACTVAYTLPPALAPGDYTLTSLFTGGLTAASSRNERLITVAPATSTVVANAVTAHYSPLAQQVILTGSVTTTATSLPGGTVTFQVRNDAAGSAPVGPAVVTTVSNGQIQGTLDLPAGLAPGAYRIETTYATGNTAILGSTDDTRNLTIIRVPIITESTTTAKSAVTTGAAQPLSLQASVASLIGIPLNQGTVTFRISRNGTALGTAVTSSTLSNGSTAATYTLPATIEPGIYDIRATYNGSEPALGAAYAPSSGLATLSVISQQQAWRELYFGTTSANGIAAPTADPDGDRLSNLIEYAFGLDPTSGSSSSLPAGQLTAGGAYQLSFIQPSNVNDVVYGLEWSPTMQPGSWLPVPDTGSGMLHTFTMSTAGRSRAFFRFVIVLSGDD